MLYPLSYEGGGWRIPGRKLPEPLAFGGCGAYDGAAFVGAGLLGAAAVHSGRVGSALLAV